MERHHFAQSMCILNTEGCNILENLTKEEYTQCLDMIRDMILATDLAHHLRSADNTRNIRIFLRLLMSFCIQNIT